MNVSPTDPGVRMSDADMPTLIAAWEGAFRAMHAAAGEATATQWLAPTECPGWTVADVVAHVVAIESDVAGRPDPPHDVDWAALPRVGDDAFRRYTETGVDLRRGRSQAEVLAELASITEVRLAQLVEGPQQPDVESRGPAGMARPLVGVLRMRTFDTWVHVQDVRRVTGVAGDLGSAAAWVSADRLLTALNFVVGKAVGAPAGTSVRVTVQGPVSFTRTVLVDDGGRCGFVANGSLAGSAGAPDGPTVEIATDWVTYERLGCGRIHPGSAEVDQGVRLTGDTDLGARVVAALAITP